MRGACDEANSAAHTSPPRPCLPPPPSLPPLPRPSASALADPPTRAPSRAQPDEPNEGVRGALDERGPRLETEMRRGRLCEHAGDGAGGNAPPRPLGIEILEID